MIGLLDCNNFFVSCERLFRPDLAKKPVAVLSSNDGCIVARSQEVKDLGIPMGVPYFKVKDICEKEDITLFSGNVTLYRDISSRVMNTLKELVFACEVYSIDEAFFKLRKKDAESEACIIRDTIIKYVGIPVSIGVADTKTIAKYASEKAKKERVENGVCVLDMSSWLREASSVSCGTIWGIGRQTSAKLENYTIHTVADLLATDCAFLRKEFGVFGERMQLELSGTSVHSEKDDSTQKSIMSSRSFKQETQELSVLESAVAYHISHVAEKLRKKENVASRLYVSIRPNRFGSYALRGGSLEIVLESPTSDTHSLLHEALKLTRELFDPEVPYKKVGVTVGGIIPETYSAQSLFEDVSETDVLYKTTDAINAKFGRNAIYVGTIQQSQKWAANAQMKSGEYTTKWNDVAVVKA